MFKEQLNHAETIQNSLAARTIEHEQRSIAYPCSQSNDITDHDMLYSIELATAQDFESYIDMQLDGIDFNNYL